MTTTPDTLPAPLADPSALAFAPEPSPAHNHPTSAIVGYVVRQTVAEGQPLGRAAEAVRPGRDVAVYVGGHTYVAALDEAHEYRVLDLATGRPARVVDYAVVDSVYSCGCRS